MYSETENIRKLHLRAHLRTSVNGKKQEKFRQRAVALRRVSMVLLLFAIILGKWQVANQRYLQLGSPTPYGQTIIQVRAL